MYAENLHRQEEKSQCSIRFYQDCLATFGSADEDATMVLDDYGKVLFCNPEAANIFGDELDDLLARHIKDFIPDVPLNPKAPGSNVANAAHAGGRNQWREYCVFNSRKETFPVELLLDVLVVDLRYLILLWVRIPAVRSGPGAYTHGQETKPDLG